jgi:hypothetical protein
LQAFYLDVAYVFAMVSSVFQVFLQVFQIHVSSVSSAFRHMLQLLHLNILKVDRVIYFSPCLLLPRIGASFLPMPAGHPPSHPSLLDAGNIRGGANPMWASENGAEK